MIIQELIEYLNGRLLPVYQESYDNAGLQLGNTGRELKGVLICLDVTPDVVEEAIEKGMNLIVSHHPLIFNGMKKITTSNATGRMVLRLIENGIAVYSAHTNLDNLKWGVNGILAEKMGLGNCKILRPMEGVLKKLVTFAPKGDAEKVREALFAAGAGCIGAYDCCSYNLDGIGTFRASEGTHPYCGKVGELHKEEETRIEVIYEQRIERHLIHKLRKVHPYEEPAIDLIPLTNSHEQVGAGMVGKLEKPMPLCDFLNMVKEQISLPTIRCSSPACNNKDINKVAICGGSGSFLIGDAIQCHADIFLSSDFKYHDFQSVEDEIILADIGHYESEQFAKEIFFRLIYEKNSNFACQISERDRGYIYYI